MTGIDPKRLERRLRWAAAQLGLSPDASLDEVRAAWLRRLPADDFVPSSELHWAVATLLRRPSEGGWEARADEAASIGEEERLRSEVEAFAGQFWEVPVEERRRRWEELRDHCAFAPTLRARLRLLEAGLDCVPTLNGTKESPRVVELANHVRKLFVLRLGQRARVQQDILRCVRDDRKAWKVAARRLRRACPKLAKLGKDLLDKVATARPKPKRLPKMPAEPSELKLRIYRGWWLFKLSVMIAVPLLIFLTLIIPMSEGQRRYPPRANKFSPEEWKKADEIRGLTKEELKKRAEEEIRRREQK